MTRKKTMIHCMHGFLLLGGLLLHSCSGETQLDGESEMPDGKDPARQEILLNINNKLVLHKTDTRTIATAGENAISTLDVYVSAPLPKTELILSRSGSPIVKTATTFLRMPKNWC